MQLDTLKIDYTLKRKHKFKCNYCTKKIENTEPFYSLKITLVDKVYWSYSGTHGYLRLHVHCLNNLLKEQKYKLSKKYKSKMMKEALLKNL